MKTETNSRKKQGKLNLFKRTISNLGNDELKNHVGGAKTTGNKCTQTCHGHFSCHTVCSSL
jgi:hypothetical protein